jgi:hypothetical protein
VLVWAQRAGFVVAKRRNDESRRSDLVTSVPGAGQRSVERYSTERKTIPVRGFGQKNVVLAGIRVRLSATAWICSTVAGRRSIPAAARPATTSQ